ncbi:MULTISPECIES: butyrate kinase [Porphyromonadaceae]|uniref:Probable butyrate kinase n=1 Tax=Sanguibacteroides justesenii TaxID=1547597 RepID=A0A0C3RFL5_9PORP|nr:MULTISPECIES: butyrate kinase [Porphyromonadaceae]KIO43397.1 butyrate kinase [Sanguibacteroides justesenii]KIO45576.1 butyrate kinase [Sanguibacteroides justesenii]MCR9012411.1 butyrate kinase [Gabonibacter chumensis]PXZ45330.1 butyrate kinase [Sanguibacteroides justesenii]
MSYKILAINPGSTSTKIAIYEDENELFVKNIKHSSEEIARFETVASQFQFRKEIILTELKNAGFDINEIHAIVGRGGLVKPIESGVYEVNDALITDLNNPPLGEHASNLGGLIAHDIARSLNNGAKAYIADPVVVDEMEEVARLTGHPAFRRVSIFHALNQKAIARTYAKEIGKKYEDINLIIAHLGGGVSVGAHRRGRVIDVNNALDGDGPFSPERSGTLPTGQLIKMCFSGEKTQAEIKKMIKGEGGLVAYLGTNDAYEVELKAKEDPQWKLVQDAMSYQVGKAIGEMAAVLKGDVDGILLTGGIAHNPFLVAYVKEMVEFIAPLKVYPGEDEMRALAMNGLMVIRGELTGKIYQ